MQFRLRNFKRNIMKLLLNAMLPENPLLLLNLCCPRLIKYWMMFPFKLVGEMNILMEKLGLKTKEGFRRNYLHPAIEMNLIQMTMPDKPNSRNQRYVLCVSERDG